MCPIVEQISLKLRFQAKYDLKDTNNKQIPIKLIFY